MNKKTLTPIALVSIFVLMLGLSFAAVPLYDLFCRVTGFGGTTQNATANLDFIHNDNEVVVNYYKNIKGGLGSSSDDLINVLMRKTSRRIPYTK